MYRALRRRGYSKEQAARISNARTPGQRVKAIQAILEHARTLALKAFDESKVSRDDTGKFDSPGGGGGGHAAKPKPKRKPKPNPEPPAPEPVSAEAITDTLTKTGLDPALVDALSEYFTGQLAEEPEDMAIGRDAANALGAQGLVRVKPGDGPNAGIELTATGKKLMKAVAGGDIAAAMSVVEAGHERAARVLERDRARDARNQERERRRQEREQQRVERAAQRAAPTRGARGGAGAAAPGGPVLVGAGGKSLRVYKDARGVSRWAAISSTAYRDRDGEIVSRRALRNAVKAADIIGDRGPLRYWHVPGLELGACDYQAVSDDGRILIESGTFASPAIAERVARATPPWQLSIGFQHPADEPDADGVFRHVRIFERSLVPSGRAANTMTRLTIKEHTMITDDKRRALEELLGPALAGQLLAEAEQTVKAADDAGVAYKDAPAEITIGGVTYTLKAPSPPAAPTAAPVPPAGDMAEPEAMEEPDDLGDAGTLDVTDDTDVVDLTVGDLKSVIAEAMEMLIGSVSSRLNEMRAQYDAMSKAFGQAQAAQAEKDDAAARAATELAALAKSRDALAAQVAALDARLKELEGEQPAAVAQRYRASADPATVVATSPAKDNPVADAYRMIFGGNPA